MRRTGRPSRRGSTIDVLTAKRDVRSPGPRGCRGSAAYTRNPHYFFSGNDHRPCASPHRVDSRVAEQPLEATRRCRSFRDHSITRPPRADAQRFIGVQLRAPPVSGIPRLSHESPAVPNRAMRQPYNDGRLDVTWDASHDEPVTMPKGLRP